MPELPETNERPQSTPEIAKAVVTRPNVEGVLNKLPPESAKESTFLGTGSAGSLAASGEANVALGPKALEAVSTGDSNTGIGFGALEKVTTSKNSTAVGQGALSLATGGENTGLGQNALKECSTGTANVAVGIAALEKLKAAKNSTAVGAFALQESIGEANIAVGYQAGLKLTGGENIAIGTAALGQVGAGAERNVAIGIKALFNAAVKGGNVAVGRVAGEECEGEGNVFIGREAGKAEKGSNKLYIANNETTPLIKGVFSETAANQELAFYGAAPVKRAATIAEPAETTAANTKAIKELIAAVKGIGIIS